MTISGIDQLPELERRFDALDALGGELPEIAAEAIGETAKAQFAAGRSPTGDAWAPRKKDGQPALANAPDHVTFGALGSDVYEDAPDHYKFHRTGTRYMVKRNVYAEAGRLPASWIAAIDKAIERQLHEVMR